MRRRRKTEGVLCQFALDAFSATLREAFEIVEQPGEMGQTLEQARERLGAAQPGRRDARGVDEGQACDLSGALVDLQLHAMLGGDDVGFEDLAIVRTAGDLCDFEGIIQPAHYLLQVVARDLSQPRDGVEREKDAQEGDQQIDHGWEYDAGFWGR